MNVDCEFSLTSIKAMLINFTNCFLFFNFWKGKMIQIFSNIDNLSASAMKHQIPRKILVLRWIIIKILQEWEDLSFNKKKNICTAPCKNYCLTLLARLCWQYQTMKIFCVATEIFSGVSFFCFILFWSSRGTVIILTQTAKLGNLRYTQVARAACSSLLYFFISFFYCHWLQLCV